MSLEITSLYARALANDNGGDDDAWKAILELRSIGSREIFETAVEWTRSPNPHVRARGADVLSQIGIGGIGQKHLYPSEAFAEITRMVRAETDSEALRSGIAALGLIGNSLAAPLIASFARNDDVLVRLRVAIALGDFPNETESVTWLLNLMEDADEDVRDWATFGLGVQGNVDTGDIRDALARRLSDSLDTTRLEAIKALAKRKDIRVLAPIEAALRRRPVSCDIVEATCSLLDLTDEPPDWQPEDYLTALADRFAIKPSHL